MKVNRDLVLSGELPFNVIFHQIVKVQATCQSVSDPTVKEQLVWNWKISGQDGQDSAGQSFSIHSQGFPNIPRDSTVVASSSWRQLCLSVDVHLASSLFRFPHLVSRRPLCLHWFPPFRKRTSSLVPPTALALVSSLASPPTLPTLDQLDKVAASNSGDHPPLPSLLPILSERFSQDKMQQESRKEGAKNAKYKINKMSQCGNVPSRSQASKLSTSLNVDLKSPEREMENCSKQYPAMQQKEAGWICNTLCT